MRMPKQQSLPSPNLRLGDGGQVDLKIDDAEFRAIVKRHHAGLFDDLGSFGVHPIEGRGDAAFISFRFSNLQFCSA